MINLKEQYLLNKKKLKMHIVLSIVFAILFLTSVTLFIVLSNYKIETLMKIVGSVTSSIFVLVLISEIVGWLVPLVEKDNCLDELLSTPESKITGTISGISKSLITIRKGILAFKVTIDETELYCDNPEVIEKLIINESVTLIVRGAFIMGVEDEK